MFKITRFDADTRWRDEALALLAATCFGSEIRVFVRLSNAAGALNVSQICQGHPGEFDGMRLPEQAVHEALASLIRLGLVESPLYAPSGRSGPVVACQFLMAA